MKCLICAGKTLSGAKLCLPCRAALRRARDDTISELLPLPRRREALAYASGSSVVGALPVNAVCAARRRAARRGASPLRRITPAHFRRAAIASFIVVAGVVAFVTVHELQRERGMAAAGDGAAVPPAGDGRAVVQRVSPSTLLGTARDENAIAANASALAAIAAETPQEFPAPPAVAAPERRVDKPVRARSRTLPVTATPILLEPEPPPVILRAPAPAVAPGPVKVAAPDRGQLLAAALARCSGDNFFSRMACEHRSRAQYCDGLWGQHPQCPGGVVSNDHGQ
jgi:hypothetical protein